MQAMLSVPVFHRQPRAVQHLQIYQVPPALAVILQA